MKTHPPLSHILAILALTTAAASSQSTYVGTNNNAADPGSGLFNVATNWSPVGVPVSSNTTDLVLSKTSGASGYTLTQNIGGTFTLNDLSLDAVTASVTIAPSAATNRFRFEDDGVDLAGISSTGGNTATLNIGFDLANNLTASQTGAGTLALAGSGSSINLGTNTLTLSGNAGQITVGARDSGSSGTITGGGAVVVNRSGSTPNANMNGASTYAGGTTLTAGNIVIGTSSVGAGASVTNGPLGTGTLVINGLGSTLRGAGFSGGFGSYVLGNNITVNTNFNLGGNNDSVIDLKGSVTLTGNRTITVVHSTGTNTPARQIISGPIGESGGARSLTVATLVGTPATLELGGTNTYTGNTTINTNASVNLVAGGSLRFVIGGAGTNNSVTGTGTFVADGAFAFDLGAASTNIGDSWTIVAAALIESYGTNFIVSGFNGAGGVWTNSTNGVDYVFQQSTGVLNVAPSSANNYSNWVAYWQGVDPGFTNTAGTADPEGDGFVNDLEFAFDGNPTTGTPALLTAVKSGTNAVLNWVQRKNPPGGVTYSVEHTTNLATGPWTNASVTISNSANQSGLNIPADYERKEIVVPATNSAFFRVKAVVNP